MTTMTRNKNKYKTKIDWDLNVFCPEQWYGADTTWDHEHWIINARIYDEGKSRDTKYTITLLEKEARALGLVDFANMTNFPGGVVPKFLFTGSTIHYPDSSSKALVLDDWIDAGLDGFIDLYHFNRLYRDKCSDRILEFIDTLPQYHEDVPEHMVY